MQHQNDLPVYLWVIELAAVAGIAAATCLVLYTGAIRTGAGHRRATLLAGGAAVVLGGWFSASAVIAANGGYQNQLGHGVPWLPIAVLGFLGALIALGRIPAVTRALTRPDMIGRLLLPHTFRVAGVVFLAAIALGRLPALFALPAGLGDIATGIAAALVARRFCRDTGWRSALSVNVFGMIDLVVALTLGTLTAFQLINITPSSELIGDLPLALIPTAAVPLLLALHITSLSTLLKTRPAAASRRADDPTAQPTRAGSATSLT